MTTLLISHTTTNQTTKQKHLWISSKVTSSFNLFTLFKQQDFVATSFAIIQTQISLNQYVLSPVILLKIDKNLFFQQNCKIYKNVYRTTKHPFQITLSFQWVEHWHFSLCCSSFKTLLVTLPNQISTSF